MRQPKVIKAAGSAMLASYGRVYFVLTSGTLVYSSKSLCAALRVFGSWL